MLTRQYAKENPDDASALYKLIVDDKDYDAMHAFIARMKGSNWEPQKLPAEQDTEHEGLDPF